VSSRWSGRDVINILDFSRSDLEELFDTAKYMEEMLDRGSVDRLLEGKIISLAFFEPSTRTRLSFETAAKRLGASTIGFTGEEAISVAKGENLADTIRMLSSYSDLIVMRHRYEGAALYASEVSSVPVINGGDGRQHHPTQAMLDLYTVNKIHGGVDGLVYGVLGDLRYGRAAASFLLGLTLFKPSRVYLISPPSLSLRREVKMLLEERSLPMEEAGLADRPLRNLVFMGMGEPLANYRNLVKALKILTHPKGFHFARKRTTVSTVGLVPQIRALAEEYPVALAISLHAPENELRARLIPATRRYPLEEILAACRDYPLRRGARITVEYVLLEEVNDHPWQARRLVEILRGLSVKVNLIPFNPHPELPFKRPSEARVRRFQEVILSEGLVATVRKSKGLDIGAACGQLRAELSLS